MAQGRESGREEGQRDAGLVRALQVAQVMGRTRDKATPAEHSWPATATQMDAGAQGGRQPDVAGYHQCKSPRAADAAQISAEGETVWLAIVPQHDTGETDRQPRRRWPRIRQPARIGEQPEARKLVRPAGRMGPGEQVPIHRVSGGRVLTDAAA